MTADTRIRQLTAAAVLLVAVIAAVVSFIHIEHLAVTHGQTQLAAWLLPVSVDGAGWVAAWPVLVRRGAGLGLVAVLVVLRAVMASIVRRRGTDSIGRVYVISLADRTALRAILRL